MDLKSIQRPFKERYRSDPQSSRIATDRIEAVVEGDLDLAGTLGVSKTVPVGSETIPIRFDIAAPQATADQLRALREKTEQYCVVLQTLTHSPKIETDWE